MGRSRQRNYIRGGKVRRVTTDPKARGKPAPSKTSGRRTTAGVLRDLRRESRSASDELPRISPTQAVREMRDGIPATTLRHIRAGLQRARIAAIVCAQILRTQAADYDTDVALTLRDCVARELFRQMVHIARLLAEVGVS